MSDFYFLPAPRAWEFYYVHYHWDDHYVSNTLLMHSKYFHLGYWPEGHVLTILKVFIILAWQVWRIAYSCRYNRKNIFKMVEKLSTFSSKKWWRKIIFWESRPQLNSYISSTLSSIIFVIRMQNCYSLRFTLPLYTGTL